MGSLRLRQLPKKPTGSDDRLNQMSGSVPREEELRLLQSVAEAASDLRLAHSSPTFARRYRGVKKLRAELFEKVAAWESWSIENEDDSSIV